MRPPRYKPLSEIDSDFIYEEMINIFPARTLVDETVMNSCINADIIGYAMGKEYMGNLVRGPRTKSNTKDFFGPMGELRSNLLWEFMARCLWKIRKIEGLDTWLSEKSNDDPESFMHELGTVAFLIDHADSLHFKQRTHEKSYDFDVTINGVQYCVEAKAKFENTDYSIRSLAHSIKKAANQMPTNKIGIVIVYIPNQWLSKQEISNDINAVIEKSFSKLPHIEGIFLRAVMPLGPITEKLHTANNAISFYARHGELREFVQQVIDKNSTNIVPRTVELIFNKPSHEITLLINEALQKKT